MAQRLNIWQAASNGDLQTVKELINEGGASPDARDGNSYTPLAAASSWSHPEVVRWLVLEAKADVNLTDDEGESALFLVEELDIAMLLVEELGADYKLKNGDGLTAAEVHEQNGEDEIANYLYSLPGMYRITTDTPSTIVTDDNDGRLTALDPNGDALVNHPNVSAMTHEKAEDLFRQVQELVERPDLQYADRVEELQELVTKSVMDTFADGQAQSDILKSRAETSQRKSTRNDQPER